MRLDDGRVGEVGVDADDPPIRAVVETAVGPDRPVDPMHHPRAATREAAKPGEIEVEGVVEAGRRVTRDAVRLHAEAPALQLADQREQELVAAPVGRRLELVEDGDVGAPSARPQPVALRPGPAGKRPRGTSRRS